MRAEQISLLNVATVFSSTLIKKSEKLSARDIDEESPNHFVAYVDDGDASCDVKIVLNSKKEVVESICDCENKAAFCSHKLSLLLALASKKSPQLIKSVRKRKQTETDIILEDIPHEELKIWIIDLFKKNKDLELLFLNEFKPSNASFIEADIKALIKDTVKSVLKNRKNIDASQLKKTLDLLESSLNPVMKNIVVEASKEETLYLFAVMMNALIAFEENVYINSIKIQRFVEKLGNQYLAAIYNIKDVEAWKTICKSAFSIFLNHDRDTYHMYHLQFLYDIYNKIPPDNDKKIFYIEQWTAYILKSNQQKFSQFPDVNTFIIKISLETNVFDKYYSLFSPIKYQNEYNELLFEALLSIKKYNVVEIYAKAQINVNSDKKYNHTYYGILKTIYALQNKDDEFMKIALDSILSDFDFETYLFVKNKRPKEFAAFKKNIYRYSNSVFQTNNYAAELLFVKIFVEERDFQAIEKYSPAVKNLSIFNDFFEQFSSISKINLFYFVCRLEYFNDNFDKSEINRSIKLFNTYYNKDEIEMAAKLMKSRVHGIIYKSLVKT